MMAAEAGAEEGGSVTSAGMVRAVGGAESEHYPTLCRGKELGPQGSFLVGSGGDAPGAGGPALCSALGFLSLGSGPAPLVSGGGGAVTTTGQGQEMSGGLLPPPEPSTVAFPPPPQPPSLAGGLGTVDEGDSLDGPEYEEEEVAIPLNAPPTNQLNSPHKLSMSSCTLTGDIRLTPDSMTQIISEMRLCQLSHWSSFGPTFGVRHPVCYLVRFDTSIPKSQASGVL
ncbi:uncharacterized protein LOC141735439 isoform X2 [Larus michahellis]|uniref:uncharacterized protein LOC141735439 isoform X2 n=1 Tax=Larus michahellis TaxID=119627 RepID=UPI003D9B39B8